MHGVVRATMDVDVVADLRLEHAERFAQALGDAFYVHVAKGARVRRALTVFALCGILGVRHQ